MVSTTHSTARRISVMGSRQDGRKENDTTTPEDGGTAGRLGRDGIMPARAQKGWQRSNRCTVK